MNLQKQFEHPIKVNLVDGINKFKQGISKQTIYEAWLNKDWPRLMNEIGWDKLQGHLTPAFDKMTEAGMSASEFTLEALPKQLNESLVYSLNNPRLQGYLTNRTGALIVNLTDDIQKVVQDQIAFSFDSALTPRQVADQIVGSIGLYPQLQTALENYRTKLAEDGMDEDRVAQLSGEYEDRLLDYRAMTIARTETKAAANYGQLSVWEAGAEQGLLDPATTMKVWVTDVEPCKICEPMDGKAVKLNEFWTVQLPKGDFIYVDVPNETHPNCLCDMTLDFGDSQDMMEANTPEEEE